MMNLIDTQEFLCMTQDLPRPIMLEKSYNPSTAIFIDLIMSVYLFTSKIYVTRTQEYF